MFKHYIQIARPDHWFKNVFMIPGIIMGVFYEPQPFTAALVWKLLLGIFATCLIASANYVINEWLDLEFDKLHPIKKNRPAVVAKLNPKIITVEYILLALSGLTISYFFISAAFFYIEVLLLLMGMIYNIKPMRSKDKPYIDVLSESVNNPIRFMLGWLIIISSVYPPSSILVAYWMGGAFLMATKRLAEYRYINDAEIAGKYRRSFKYYTEENLLISTFFYALCSSFFLAIFLVKHRIELIISFPFIALLFSWYLKIGFEKNSIVQTPEKLHQRKGFIAFTFFLFVLFLALLYVDLPWLRSLLKPFNIE